MKALYKPLRKDLRKLTMASYGLPWLPRTYHGGRRRKRRKEEHEEKEKEAKEKIVGDEEEEKGE